MITNLKKIREFGPCIEGWEKLLKYLGKTLADDEPLPLLTVLDSNGIDDALWCLRAVDGHDKEKRLFAVWCVRQVEHLFCDARSVYALNVTERYAHGKASDDELLLAWEAARAAAWSASWSASWSAAESARAAARPEAARAAARAAAWAAAWAAADRPEAGVAAWEAARAAAWSASWSAAESARAAAGAAADRAEAARAEQEAKFRDLLVSTSGG